jgi:hypothetical protein
MTQSYDRPSQRKEFAMYCPECGSRTEVAETRGAFRDRRCRKPDCALEFTTRELVVNLAKQRTANCRQARFCARTRATQIEINPISPVVAEAAKSRPVPAPLPEALLAEMEANSRRLPEPLSAAVVAEVEARLRPAPALLPEFVELPVMQQAMLEFGSN